MEGAYNSEMYKRPCKGKQQEDYCAAVKAEWCDGKLDTDEHQKPVGSLNLGTGETQSDAKPSQW